MADKSWKRAERIVSKKVGGIRNPLSGSGSRHTSGDVIHEKFYIEVKQRRRFSVLTTMHKVEKLAAKEKKVPILVLHEKGMHNRYYIMPEKEFVQMVGNKK